MMPPLERMKSRLTVGALLIFAGLIASAYTSPPTQFDDCEFAKFLRSQPVLRNGVLIGLRVYPGEKREKFFCMGFKPGDLIRAVSDMPLDSLSSVGARLNLIVTEPRVVLKIDRTVDKTPTQIETYIETGTGRHCDLDN